MDRLKKAKERRLRKAERGGIRRRIWRAKARLSIPTKRDWRAWAIMMGRG